MTLGLAAAVAAVAAAAAPPGSGGGVRASPAPDLSLCVSVVATANASVDAAAWVATTLPLSAVDALRELADNLTALGTAELVAALPDALSANLTGTVSCNWAVSLVSVDVAAASLALRVTASGIVVRNSRAHANLLPTLTAQAQAALADALPQLPIRGDLLEADVDAAAWTSQAAAVQPSLAPPAADASDHADLTGRAAALALCAAVGMGAAVVLYGARFGCVQRRLDRRRTRMSRSPYEQVHSGGPVVYYNNSLAAAAHPPTIAGQRGSKAYLNPTGAPLPSTVRSAAAGVPALVVVGGSSGSGAAATTPSRA